MAEEFIMRYDVKQFLDLIPKDEDELFIGFSAYQRDMEGWRQSMREDLLEEASRPLRRSVWAQLESSEGRVLIDVAECSSAKQAMESLVIRLEGNELAELDKGPDELGTVSFVHPQGLPPAVYFAHGNLCVSIVGIAQPPVDVLAVAQSLDSRLQDQPKTMNDTTIRMTAEQDRAKVGETVRVSFHLPWRLAEEGYLKFRVHGGSIGRANDSIIVTGSKPGTLRLEALAIEPGREPSGGMISLSIE